MQYEIKRYELIQTGLLEPHPDAMAYPSDADDREIVDASTNDVGTLQPLIVMQAAKGKHGTHACYLVLDGCGRLSAAFKHNVEQLPCLVVDCDNPRDLAMNINSAGRKRTTGSRVLCYLMANRAEVMKAYAATEYARGCVSHDTHPPKKGAGSVPEELEPWTIKEISKRLGVSNKDVQMALELMVCHNDCTYPSKAVYGKYAPGTPIEDSETEQALRKAFDGVICGRTPVRRWAAAFAGRVNTAGQGKAPTNWAALFERTTVTLLNCLEHAPEIRWETPGQQERTRQNLLEFFEKLPDVQRHDLIDIIAKNWSDAEKSALVKRIGKTK